MTGTPTNLIQSISLVPAARNASANGTGVDLSNYGANSFNVLFGVVTDGTHTPKLQESSDNSTFTDVAAADQVGSFSAVTSSSGGSAGQSVGYIGALRYVRVVITVSGATTGALSTAYASLGKPRRAN